MRLEARNICLQIGSQRILDGIWLSVASGEVVVVVGPNGAGKSTLLKVLCGDLQPQRGEVWMNERLMDGWGRRERAKVRAVLPQSSSLSFAFTVLDVALIGRSPYLNGGESPKDYAIAREALAAVGMLHLQARLYTTLSGGERQRVQLARVMAQIWDGQQPRYLLLDEPTNSLDLAHQHGTLEIVCNFARSGVGILAILHDLNLAAQYADRIVILNHGQSIASGPPNYVLTPSTIQQAFDIPVMVSPHPCYNCPLVIPVPMAQSEVQEENLL